MNAIHVAMQENPGAQWWDWIKALSQTGFNVILINPGEFETSVRAARPGDVVLLDGMLMDLSERIYRTCTLAPETSVVVLTEVDSFTVDYEVLSVGGAIYVSGPMASHHFVEKIGRIVGKELVGEEREGRMVQA